MPPHNLIVRKDNTRADELKRQGTMDKLDARILLATHLTNEALLDEGAANELLEVLAYTFPAIEQAAAFINTNSLSVKEYIAMLRHIDTTNASEKRLEMSRRYHEAINAITKTWHISFQQIRKRDTLAAEYILFMACINHSRIPQSLLPPGDSPARQARALHTLTKYAFISTSQQKAPEAVMEVFFDMHPLVHGVSVMWLENNDKLGIRETAATSRLNVLLPSRGHTRKGSWISYLPHAISMAERNIRDDETARSQLLSRIGMCQMMVGQYSAAAKTYRRVLLMKEQAFGKADEQTLVTRDDLAQALLLQGLHEEAESMLGQTLRWREKMLGLSHSDTLTSMSNVALALHGQGKYDESCRLSELVLAWRQKLLGPGHRDTLASLNNLAAVLDSQGRYKEAEMMNRQVVSGRKKELGYGHPDTLITMNNLGLTLNKLGKHDEAEAIHRQTVALREALLCRDHPDTLISMSNLAGALNSQGRYEEAESVNRRVWAKRKRVLGSEHPHTILSLSKLAVALDNQGKYDEAEMLNRQVLSWRAKELGPANPDTLISMNNLALILHGQGKHGEAEAINRHTLKLRGEVLGPKHPHTLTSMNNLALVLQSQGQDLEAVELNRQTLALTQEVLGPGHPDTLTSMSNLATVLQSQGRYQEARRIYRQTVARREMALGRGNTKKSIQLLACVLADKHCGKTVALFKSLYAATFRVSNVIIKTLSRLREEVATEQVRGGENYR
jgi:tetratricopeptide (TPR) repeat protein